MTIKELIIEKELPMDKERLEKLIEMGAPEIIITSLSEQIKEMENGELKIGGDLELLDYEFRDYEVKRRKSGKIYIVFDKSIIYSPYTKYGRYIKRS